MTMSEHNLFYHPYASFTNAQLPPLKVAALYFDKLVIVDPVGASWATVGADHQAGEAVNQSQDAGILQTVTPPDVLTKNPGPMTDVIRRDGRQRSLPGPRHKRRPPRRPFEESKGGGARYARTVETPRLGAGGRARVMVSYQEVSCFSLYSPT
jgi:hypothetical protein